MNVNIARGNWQKLTGVLLEQWGRLTGNPVRRITGRHQRLAGRLNVAYGVLQQELGREMQAVRLRSGSGSGLTRRAS